MSETTIGRILMNGAAPEDMRDDSRVFDKKKVQAFFQELAERHPDKYVDTLQRMSDVARMSGTEYGGVASLKLKDLRLPPQIKAYREQLRQRVHAINQDPGLSTEEKSAAVVDVVRKAMPIVQKNLEAEMHGRDNAFGEQVRLGFKGSPMQMTQLIFGDLLNADQRGKPVPIPGLHGYGEGVSPSEYFGGSFASRAGYVSVQFATAKTGFLGKQMAAAAQHVTVTGKDCGADKVGVTADGDDPDILGAVLARPVGNLPAGTTITKQNLGQLAGKKPLIRSLLTCQQDEGVCQKCAGLRENHKFAPLGASIGIDSARTLSEPLTQGLALSAKHVGGVVGVNSDNLGAFDEINQFVQVPEHFKGASVLAPVEGRIRQIVKAPQGGHYMHVDSEQIYIPGNRKITVAPGDVVEAGDMLTDGTPNPAELVQHKGLGEGRVYFQKKFGEILKNHGVGTHPRNVAVLSRSFFDRVRITSPDGVMGHIIDDVVPYSQLQKEYEPRLGTKNLAPKRAVGQYLERPVLHYTIGTKITPKVAQVLDQDQIDEIQAHPEAPGFEPEVSRIMDISADDPDWKTRMAGFGVKRSFLDAVQHGSTSKNTGPGMIPKLMDPTRL